MENRELKYMMEEKKINALAFSALRFMSTFLKQINYE